MTNPDLPLVSVIVTCFNTPPDQLEEALDSARAQTYEQVEIIVVDDGSSQAGTLAFLDAVEAGGARVLRQANQGVSAARNYGMTEGHGEFILPLDGDDVLDPGYLAATVPVLYDNADLAIVSTRAEYFGERTGLVDLPDPSLPWMVAENSIHNTSLFRRDDFVRLGGYDEQLTRGFEDHEWWVRLMLAGGGAQVLDDILFRYRIRSTSRNAAASTSNDALKDLRVAMMRNNPEHAHELTEMALHSLDSALERMHASEARVAHLEHHLGPVVRAFDRSPGIKRALERARRVKNRDR